MIGTAGDFLIINIGSIDELLIQIHAQICTYHRFTCMIAELSTFISINMKISA